MIKSKGALLALVLSVAAFALPEVARAQGCGQQNPNCIVPTAPPGTSNNQAASTAFVTQAIGHAAGGTNGQIQYNNNGAFGGFTAGGDATINTATGTVTIQPNAVTNGKINPGAANTFKGTLNGTTTSDIALTACTLSYQITKWIAGTGWQCGFNPVLPSRAIAATLDLSAFSVVTTQGYGLPGDGGGAVFVKVSASTAFIDSFISTGTIAGGSGYTNGSYFGTVLTGGSGRGAVAVVTVSGNAVTSVFLAGTPGNAYKVGDVLTASIPGGSGFTYTVSAVTAPLASFTDSAGNKFQFKPDQGTYPNTRQFGAKLDWDGNDATATNDFASVQAALFYAYFGTATSWDIGGAFGGRVLMGPGSSLICGPGNTLALVIPAYVTLDGAGAISSTLKMCDTFDPGSHFMWMGDANWHRECFNVAIKNLQIFANRNVNASPNIALVYSNCAGDFGEINHVYLSPGKRMCTFFEAGIGTVTFDSISCAANTASNMIQFGVVGTPIGTQFITLRDVGMAGPTSGTLQTGPGLSLNGGFHRVDNIHCESVPSCIRVNIDGATGAHELVQIHNSNAGNIPGGTACAANIVLEATNRPNNTIIGATPQGSCPIVVLDLQPGGSNVVTDIVLDRAFNP